MKKNYLLPVTEKVLIENCFAICDGSKEQTPMDNPQGDPFEAPCRKLGNLYF